MAWTSPRTWVTGETVTAALMNTHVRDNMTALKAAVGTRQAVWYITGVLTTGTNKSAELKYRGPTGTIKRADAAVKVAPTDADLILDINIDGTSIWASTQANRVTVAAAATSGTQTSFDTTSLTDGKVLTLDIDQVGSTIAGSNLTVLLEIEYTVEVA